MTYYICNDFEVIAKIWLKCLYYYKYCVILIGNNTIYCLMIYILNNCKTWLGLFTYISIVVDNRKLIVLFISTS